MKFCTKCGAKIPDDAQVCPQCAPSLNAEISKELETVKPTTKKKLNKLIIIIPLIIIIIAIITFTILILTHVICINHKWIDATCTNPQKCHYCDETQGKSLGHSWKDADCENPKTCSNCGKTKGDALGHDWSDATCTTPKTCDNCYETQGDAIGHTWIDADCENPEICSVCNATQGEAMGHIKSEWTLTKEATLVNVGVEEIHCSTCNKILDSRGTERKTPKVTGSSFNFTDDEFIEWINDNTSVIVGSTDLELDGIDGANTTYSITSSDGEIGIFIINHGDNGRNGNICGIMIYFNNLADSGALAAWIGENINSNFYSQDAFYKFAAGKSYTSANMTAMQLDLEEDFSVYIIAPTDYLEDLLS